MTDDKDVLGIFIAIGIILSCITVLVVLDYKKDAMFYRMQPAY